MFAKLLSFSKKRFRHPRLRELASEQRVIVAEDLPLLKTLNRIGGLIDMLESLPRLRKVVEVGSHLGVSTEALAFYADDLSAVDDWPHEGAFLECSARLKRYSHVRMIRRRSPEAAGLFENESLDLVYIDGDHGYDSVSADIRAWFPKIRPGGWISGHDWTTYAPFIQVIPAVTDTLGVPDAVFRDTSWIIQKTATRSRSA